MWRSEGRKGILGGGNSQSEDPETGGPGVWEGQKGRHCSWSRVGGRRGQQRGRDQLGRACGHGEKFGFHSECAGPEGNGSERGCRAGQTWPDENLVVTDFVGPSAKWKCRASCSKITTFKMEFYFILLYF